MLTSILQNREDLKVGWWSTTSPNVDGSIVKRELVAARGTGRTTERLRLLRAQQANSRRA